jgi:DNA-directed RNA polymerase subunit beta'
MISTIGKVLINQALPEKYRDYSIDWDEKTLKNKLMEIAKNNPELYSDTLQNLFDVGKKVSTVFQRISVGVSDLKPLDKFELMKQKIQKDIENIVKSESNPVARNKKIVEKLMEIQDLKDKFYEEFIKTDNPLSIMSKSGTKGNKYQLARILLGDLVYFDQNENPIPFPVLRSYAQSVSPAEFWAATYGARKGLAETKLGTGKVGYLSKQFFFNTHRIIVDQPPHVKPEDFDEPKNVRALPVSVDEPDIEGSVLAREFGGYKRGTILTAKILQDLKNKGIKDILIRSPINSNSPSGGIYAIDVGIREKGTFPEVGEMIGLIAAQALSERITQLQISAKHSGGVAGAKGVSGLESLNKMLQVPEMFPGAMVYSTVLGKVTKIEDSPLGGKDVYVLSEEGESKSFYVPSDREVTVKVGDKVEAGDSISTGIPNISQVVKYKGIGEGRRSLRDAIYEFYKQNGLPVIRKNIELLVRGIVDHIQIKKRYNYFLPGDIIKYSDFERFYKIRPGSVEEEVDKTLNKYLEKPVLHYTIGTKITPRVIETLKKFDIDRIVVNSEPPIFEPIMVPLERQILYDPDWQTKLLGGYQLQKFLNQFYEGAVSELRSTSFVPALASGEIGEKWPLIPKK